GAGNNDSSNNDCPDLHFNKKKVKKEGDKSNEVYDEEDKIESNAVRNENPRKNEIIIAKVETIKEIIRQETSSSKGNQKDNIEDTPEQEKVYFDKEKFKGKIFENNEEIKINNPNVDKTQKSLNEFIIEKKELISLFSSYKYKPEQFNVEYLNGDRYLGYFSPEWTKEVFGILQYKNGTHYEGQFKNDKYNGRGRLILPLGDYYEGEFIEDKAYGFEKYI
ncbi:MAG: hypothetical protein MJ252_10910, partial [archaeon]|nr:hypothetical protein [archaeon]